MVHSQGEVVEVEGEDPRLIAAPPASDRDENGSRSGLVQDSDSERYSLSGIPKRLPGVTIVASIGCGYVFGFAFCKLQETSRRLRCPPTALLPCGLAQGGVGAR
eukprot:GHVU01216150.1.p2 GENE.GHVU01216150.1~~GHVU01216150.1.p2  ORF type:complete len:104 (+),score=4.67 GHVU01216150.1:234-545(+)